MSNNEGHRRDAMRLWNDYANATGVGGAKFSVRSFGDNAELEDDLAALVISGAKRATTWLACDFPTGAALPKAGDLTIVVDGRNVPRCIVRTVRVETKALRDVDERYAWLEGEGDRSLAWWMSAHRRYFRRQAARKGFSIDDGAEVVLEEFKVVWPPELADRI